MSHSVIELMEKKEVKRELLFKELEKLEKEMETLKEVLEEDLNIRKCDCCSEWKHNYDDRFGCMCEDCYLERNGILWNDEEWELKSSFHAEDIRMEN